MGQGRPKRLARPYSSVVVSDGLYNGGFKRDRVGYSRHKALLTQPTEDTVRHRRQPEILGRASDKRAIQPYEDAEAILAEATKIQEHLQTQDVVLEQLVARMEQAMTGLRLNLGGLAGVLPMPASVCVARTHTVR
jgi:hypothetical protein